jgi:hypothetical protein
MFSKRQSPHSLEPPPLANEDPNAIEVLRVWASSGKPQQITLKTVWGDSGAWGLLLVDVARHAAEAYARDGRDRTETLARIKALFDAEWTSPTDTPARNS